ncbi:hypothetical protein KP509_23G036600 [Ceratopteris richardii]|uniref:DCD domain-containing protein n=1 Tax=Ceratopteris richardii TaxID=49495 RepID=A0A8T2S162_CERRI|nr:hypothetical protein KP509_23G036600 [Ceratopteris richardii]
MGAPRKQHCVRNHSDCDWRDSTTHKDIAGHIFFYRISAVSDLERLIFGLPAKYLETVRQIKKGMPLFLFNYSNRLMFGGFEAATNGGYNLDPYAWENTGKRRYPVSRYPAQVGVCIVRELFKEGLSLGEATFGPIMEYIDGRKFRLDLNAWQVKQLLECFRALPSLEWDLVLDRNVIKHHKHKNSSREPESPRSAHESESDYCSDCSSRASSGEEYTSHETFINKPDYHHVDEVATLLSERLNHTDISESLTYSLLDVRAPLEDQIHGPCYKGFDSIGKEQLHGGNHCTTSDFEDRIILQFPKTYTAINVKSDSGTANAIDHRIVVDGEYSSTLPVQTFKAHLDNEKVLAASCTMQCPETESTAYIDHSVVKWENRKRSSLENCRKQISNQQIVNSGRHFRQEMSTGIHKARVRPPKRKPSISYFMEDPDQVREQVQQVTMGSSILISASEPHAHLLMQMCDRVDEPCQNVEMSNDIQKVLDRSEGFLQGGHAQIFPMSAIIRPPPLPQQALLKVDADAIHHEILKFTRSTRPSSEVQCHVEAAIDCVRKGVKEVWPGADVEVFGSFATGLCLQHSDVDLAIIDPPRLSSEDLSIAQVSPSLIRELAAGLRQYEWCESINPLETASMPVLKCLCRPFASLLSTNPAIAVDITIGGSRNSARSTDGFAEEFISCHTGGAARDYVLKKILDLTALAPLVLLLKCFLHHKGLSNVYSGGLGSFSLTLLVAFFLEKVDTERYMNSRTSNFPSSVMSTSFSCFSEFSDDLYCLSSHSGNGVNPNMSGDSSLGKFYVRRAFHTVGSVLSYWDQTDPKLGPLLLGFLKTFGFLRDLSREKIVLQVNYHCYHFIIT